MPALCGQIIALRRSYATWAVVNVNSPRNIQTFFFILGSIQHRFKINKSQTILYTEGLSLARRYELRIAVRGFIIARHRKPKRISNNTFQVDIRKWYLFPLWTNGDIQTGNGMTEVKTIRLKVDHSKLHWVDVKEQWLKIFCLITLIRYRSHKCGWYTQYLFVCSSTILCGN